MLSRPIIRSISTSSPYVGQQQESARFHRPIKCIIKISTVLEPHLPSFPCMAKDRYKVLTHHFESLKFETNDHLGKHNIEFIVTHRVLRSIVVAARDIDKQCCKRRERWLGKNCTVMR